MQKGKQAPIAIEQKQRVDTGMKQQVGKIR